MPHVDTLNGPKLMPSSKTQHGVLISGIPKLNIAFRKDKSGKGLLWALLILRSKWAVEVLLRRPTDEGQER